MIFMHVWFYAFIKHSYSDQETLLFGESEVWAVLPIDWNVSS